jgi:hypothetical protein
VNSPVTDGKTITPSAAPSLNAAAHSAVDLLNFARHTLSAALLALPLQMKIKALSRF